MISSAARYYTALDFESVLRQLLEQGKWPEWLSSVTCFPFELQFCVLPSGRRMLPGWLSDEFGPRFDAKNNLIMLDGSPRRSLQISVEEVSEIQRVPLRFLFDPSLTLARFRSLHEAAVDKDAPAVFAFHSFKGGVGRTTCALAFAQELAGKAEGGRKVLLVDADLEAPGITFLLEQRFSSIPISFADILALVNEDLPLGSDRAVSVAADSLRDLEYRGIFYLPAFRSLAGYEANGIRPDHLIRNSTDPFVLSRTLRKIGKALGVDAVVVDLRAGVSEISSGLLLDPTVCRVLVSTLGGQSTHGTAAILSRLSRSDQVLRGVDSSIPTRDLFVVLSQVRDEHRESILPDGIERLSSVANDVFPGSEAVDGAADALLPKFAVVDFVGELSLLNRSLDDCLAQIDRSGMAYSLRPIGGALFLPRAVPDMPADDVDERRKRLQSFAKNVEYAESGKGGSFLATAPLKRLASDHVSEVPVVAVIGQKGSGKSYTYLQLVRERTWSGFTNRVAGKASVAAGVFPLLEPANLLADARALTDAARNGAVEPFGLAPLPPARTADALRNGLLSMQHEGQWRDHWLHVLARAAGLPGQDPTAEFTDAFAQSGGKRLVFVIDGLEDLFQSVHTDSREQLAVRSLLQEVIAWLAQIPERPVGVVIFVRQDMVAASIKQNSGQFFRRFQSYELRWDRLEALRLVGWVANQSGATALSVDEEVGEGALVESLVPLWGLKLGSDESREATTSEWVLAALSDFRGQVQARDVVRFLRVTSTQSIGDAYWGDRLLTPSSLRKAPVECGREKIAEISQEVPQLGTVLSRLNDLPVEKKRVPFLPIEIHLTTEEVDLLDKNGIVLREPDGYYMPEMFRQGLGFVVPQGARPRVLALARRARVGVG